MLYGQALVKVGYGEGPPIFEWDCLLTDGWQGWGMMEYMLRPLLVL